MLGAIIGTTAGVYFGTKFNDYLEERDALKITKLPGFKESESLIHMRNGDLIKAYESYFSDPKTQEQADIIFFELKKHINEIAKNASDTRGYSTQEHLDMIDVLGGQAQKSRNDISEMKRKFLRICHKEILKKIDAQ